MVFNHEGIKDRAKLGQRLIDELGSGLESSDPLIDDTVLATMVKERLRQGRDFDDSRSMPNEDKEDIRVRKADLLADAEMDKFLKNPESQGRQELYRKLTEDYADSSEAPMPNLLDGILDRFNLGDGVLNRLAKDEAVADVPDDPEADKIVDEAFLGAPVERPVREAPSPESVLVKLAKRREKEEKKATKKRLKENNQLLDMQLQGVPYDEAKLKLTEKENAIDWDKHVNKRIRTASAKSDKPFDKKVLKAKKLIAYAEDPQNFYKSWYAEHPVYAKQRGGNEKRPIIYDEYDNPDPDLEGVGLVKYADAMNEKFTHPAGTREKPGFIENDYGPEDSFGEPTGPEDPLAAKAKGVPFNKPEKLMFPELINEDVDPTNNKVGMVRRMLYGELDDDELAYLMELMDKDRSFATGGYVNDSYKKNLKQLQLIYGPNHPVLSDRKLKVPAHILSVARRIA